MSDPIPASFIGWLRRLRGSLRYRWAAVVTARSFAGCWVLLDAVPRPIENERVVLSLKDGHPADALGERRMLTRSRRSKHHRN
jgi:hypothetical protein